MSSPMGGMDTLISFRGRVRAVVVGDAVRLTAEHRELGPEDPDTLWVLALVAQAQGWPPDVQWNQELASRAARGTLAPAVDVVAAWSRAEDLRSLAAALGLPWEVALMRLFDRDVVAAFSAAEPPGLARGPQRRVARRRVRCSR